MPSPAVAAVVDALQHQQRREGAPLMADEFAPGETVTLAWYEPGERHRPRGVVVEPAQEDIARLDGANDGKRVLVHWRTGNWRRWEYRDDLRGDETPAAP